MTKACQINQMSVVSEIVSEVERLVVENISCKYTVAFSCGTVVLHFSP